MNQSAPLENIFTFLETFQAHSMLLTKYLLPSSFSACKTREALMGWGHKRDLHGFPLEMATPYSLASQVFPFLNVFAFRFAHTLLWIVCVHLRLVLHVNNLCSQPLFRHSQRDQRRATSASSFLKDDTVEYISQPVSWTQKFPFPKSGARHHSDRS